MELESSTWLVLCHCQDWLRHKTDGAIFSLLEPQGDRAVPWILTKSLALHSWNSPCIKQTMTWVNEGCSQNECKVKIESDFKYCSIMMLKHKTRLCFIITISYYTLCCCISMKWNLCLRSVWKVLVTRFGIFVFLLWGVAVKLHV